MNLNRIRLENNLALRRYERRGTRIFLKALRDQAESYDPDIMINAYIEFYQYVFVDSAKREYYQIRSQEAKVKDFQLDGFFLSTWRIWIKQYVLSNLLTVISGVNERTTAQIREITAQLISEGFNPNDIAKRIRTLVGSKSRAVAIARTEGTNANNLGTERSAEDWQMQTGTTLYKVWIHSGNPRDPRISHIQAQNNPIPKEDNFSIDGLSMKYPGDKNGGAAQTINCLCTHSYMSERLARKMFPEAFGEEANTQQTSASAYRKAQTLQEAKEISKNIIDQNTVLRVDSTEFHPDITLDQLNAYNEQLNNLTTEYNLSPHLAGNPSLKLMYNSKGSYGYVESFTVSGNITKINFGHLTDKTARVADRLVITNDNFATSFAGKSKVDLINREIATLTHEFGHVISIENKHINKKYPEMESFWKEIKSAKRAYSKEINTLVSGPKKDLNRLKDVYLGDYARTNNKEFMAEAFTEYKLSSNPSKYAVQVGKIIDKYFKRN